MITSALLSLAQTQIGLVTRDQLAALGCSSSWIDRRRREQWLRPVLPSVMLVAPAPDTFTMRCLAVSLWLRGDGFVTARSAGELYGLRRMREFPIEYAVPTRIGRPAPTWIKLRRTTWYDEDHDRLALGSGAIVASPRRLLFSLASVAKTQRWFDAAADDAWHNDLTTPAEMESYLERHRCRGKDGVHRIETWLERWLQRDRPSQSYFERDVISSLEDAGLPSISAQHPLTLIGGRVVRLDIAWPHVLLAVEPGHTRFHDPDADAQRDLACAELGWKIIRMSQSARSDLPRWARMIARTYRERLLLPHPTQI